MRYDMLTYSQSHSPFRLSTPHTIHYKTNPLDLQNAGFITSCLTLFQKKPIPLLPADSSPACSLIPEDLCQLNARASTRRPPLLSSFTCLLTAGMEGGSDYWGSWWSLPAKHRDSDGWSLAFSSHAHLLTGPHALFMRFGAGKRCQKV